MLNLMPIISSAFNIMLKNPSIYPASSTAISLGYHLFSSEELQALVPHLHLTLVCIGPLPSHYPAESLLLWFYTKGIVNPIR